MYTTAQQLTSQTLKTQITRWCMAGFISLTFFSYGTAMMDYFLVYPSRLLIGEREFVPYHALLEERILPISVIPFGILTLFNIALLFLKLPSTLKKLVLASFVCLLLDWLSTIFIQIPINLQLNTGKDEYLIKYIMDTNWIRIVLESAQAGIALLVLGYSIHKREAYR